MYQAPTRAAIPRRTVPTPGSTTARKIVPAGNASAAAHLVATLDKFKVPAAEKAEVLALVSTLEKDIVDQPAAAAPAQH